MAFVNLAGKCQAIFTAQRAMTAIFPHNDNTTSASNYQSKLLCYIRYIQSFIIPYNCISDVPISLGLVSLYSICEIKANLSLLK